MYRELKNLELSILNGSKDALDAKKIALAILLFLLTLFLCSEFSCKEDSEIALPLNVHLKCEHFGELPALLVLMVWQSAIINVLKFKKMVFSAVAD